MINWVIEFFFCLQIPNGLGGIFGAIQLILYACYYSSTTWEDEVNDKPQRELGPLPTTNPSSIAPRSEAWTRRRKKIGCFHHHSRSSHYPHDLFMLSRVVFRCSLFWVDTFCVGFLLFGLASCKKKHVSSFIYTWLRISMVVSSGFLHLEGGNQV